MCNLWDPNKFHEEEYDLLKDDLSNISYPAFLNTIGAWQNLHGATI